MSTELEPLYSENEENNPEKTNLLGVLVDMLATLLLSVVLFFLINVVSSMIQIDVISMKHKL